MAKRQAKNDKKKITKQESESSTAEEEVKNTSSEESLMEYSQEQLEKAEKNLEELEIDSSDVEEESNSGATESGSEESSPEGDDESLRTIFIKDIDYDLKESELNEQMDRLGEVVRVTIPLTHDQRRNKGFAYVEFKNVADAKKALKLDGTELLGRKVSVSQARPKTNQKIYTVYVKNLSYNTTKEEIKEHFSKFGKVYNVSLPVDSENSGRNKGFCFVEFTDEADVANTMKGKHLIGDRTLYLNEGNKNEDRNAKRSSDRLYGRRDNGRDDDRGSSRDGGRRYNDRDNDRGSSRDGGKRYNDRSGGRDDKGSSRDGGKRYNDRSGDRDDKGSSRDGGKRYNDRNNGGRSDRNNRKGGTNKTTFEDSD